MIGSIRILGMIAVASFLAASASIAQGPDAPRQTFSGYHWRVKSGDAMGPGPNHWSTKNVWVDSRGWLHLKISHVPSSEGSGAETWTCAELVTEDNFGFGSYEFEVSGPVDKLDKNVVLGLFDYPTPEIGPDGTNEIDIEFAHWGSADLPWLNYSVYPSVDKQTLGTDPKGNHGFYADPISAPLTWNRIERRGDHVSFRSSELKESAKPFFVWDYAPQDVRLIPQHTLPVRINLWLFRGHAPTDNKDVEIVIRKFTFTP